MSEENDELDEYELASEFAERNGVSLAGVRNSIRSGDLQGRLIDEVWYVKAKSEEASPKASKDFIGIKPVKVVEIDLSFGNIFWLTFKATFAAALVTVVIVIPVAFLIAGLLSSF